MLFRSGFLFAAPGAVMIHVSSIRKDHNGKISLAGPLVNVALAFLFMILLYTSTGFLHTLADFGVRINAWLALFNLIPVWQFDGAKIFKWSKVVWCLMVGMGLVFLFQGVIIKQVIGGF